MERKRNRFRPISDRILALMGLYRTRFLGHTFALRGMA